MNKAYLYFFFILVLSACSFAPALTPTPTLTALPSLPPSPTATFTLPPTYTLQPSLTPTITLTPTATYTPTPSETPAPLDPAVLFKFQDGDGQVIDWSYARISSISYTSQGTLKTLSGVLAFQLMDRAIHRQTMTFDSQTLTIYYLNVQHEFGGQLVPVKLILSATPGTDVPLFLIPAGGNAYLRMRILANWDIFDAYSLHRDANKAYAERIRRYPDVLLSDLQKLLPSLPDKMIVLADAQILFDPDTLAYTVRYNIDTVPYLAARAMPFLSLDATDRITGPSMEADELANFLVNLTPLPDGIAYFSSDTLVLIPNLAQVPTLP